MSTINRVNNKRYRVLKDATNKIWEELSFITDATDVYFEDGENAETKFGGFKGITTSKQTVTGYVLDATVADKAPIVLSATLAAGTTSKSFTNTAINNSALIDVYTDDPAVFPTTQIVSGTTLTLGFNAQTTAVGIKVVIYNY